MYPDRGANTGHAFQSTQKGEDRMSTVLNPQITLLAESEHIEEFQRLINYHTASNSVTKLLTRDCNFDDFLGCLIQKRGRLLAVRLLRVLFDISIKQGIAYIDGTPRLRNAYDEYLMANQAESLANNFLKYISKEQEKKASQDTAKETVEKTSFNIPPNTTFAGIFDSVYGSCDCPICQASSTDDDEEDDNVPF